MAPEKVRLVPIDLHNTAQFAELHRQRILCGWNDDIPTLQEWRQRADQGAKSLFWIVPVASDVRAGHIALQSFDPHDDPEVARADKSILCLSTLFVDPTYRSAGLGRAAVEAVEALAHTPPHGSPACHTITVHTTSRRYTEDDGPEWRGSYARRGLAQPPVRGTSSEDWYARMGYTWWKQEPRYQMPQPDGTVLTLVASFLRKAVA